MGNTLLTFIEDAELLSPFTKSDPAFALNVDAVVRRIGSLSDSYFSVHQGNEYPKNSIEARENMWLWIRKLTLGDGSISLDLENFHLESIHGYYRILYNVTIDSDPIINQSSRVSRSFSSSGSPIDDDDTFYTQHIYHKHKILHQKMEPELITKWQLTNKAIVRDCAYTRYLQSSETERSVMNLEVLSTGTAVTTWSQEVIRVQEISIDGNLVRTREEIKVHKHETIFVDRISYRLMCKDELVGEWCMNGDSIEAYGLAADVDIHSPFFTATVSDSHSPFDEYRVQTLQGIDPELSILLSHVCMTEFSMDKIKLCIKLNTPDDTTHYDNNEDMKSFFNECTSLRKSPDSVADFDSPDSSCHADFYDYFSKPNRVSPNSVTTSLSRLQVATRAVI